MKNDPYSLLKLKVVWLYCLCCQTDGPKPKYIYFTSTEDKKRGKFSQMFGIFA